MDAPNDISNRKEEIYVLISGDKVGHAVKRIMDFVADFSGDKGSLREVIVISANYNRLEKAERRGTLGFEDLEKRRNQLLYQALELVDGIEEELSMQIAV